MKIMNNLGRANVSLMSKPDICKAWDKETKSIIDAISNHNANNGNYNSVGPIASKSDMDEFRAALFLASPRLADWASTIQSELKKSSAVFIPNLGLGRLDENSRSLMTYAMAVCLGNPTATDTKQVIWDVKARKRDSTYFSTFSETDLEAAFHTDTQYYPAPEKAFLLYCMTPADCGGGLSSICDASALRSDIECAERWVSDVLSDRMLPFRVPSAFVTDGDSTTVQATLAPVFAETPLIRYRRDTLTEGALHFPQYFDADAHRALDAFERHMSECKHQVDFFMPRDSLVVVDNHKALHARTAFQDSERHLLRIRITSDDVADQPKITYQMVTRERQNSEPEIA